MLRFRRSEPAAQRTEPAPSRKTAQPALPAPDETTNAGKARALLAMLEGNGDAAGGVAPERLRDWARDLVETVERRRAVATTTPAGAPAAPALGGRLFRAPAPVMQPTPPDGAAPALAAKPATPEAAPRIERAEAPAPSSRVAAAATLAAAAAFRAPTPALAAAPGAASPTLPVPHVAEAVGAPPAAPAPAMLSRAEVRQLIEATTDAGTLAQEHPAIIAMTLTGRSTIEQAASLRRLPGGQVRAVHRALRMMEGAGH